MEKMNVLELRDNARYQLQQIKNVETGIEYLNKVRAIETWAKAEKKDAELQNMIAEQKIRTQRVLGRLIQEGQERKEIARFGKDNQHTMLIKDINKQPPKTLTEVGITPHQSMDYQRLSNYPDEQFEAEITKAKQDSTKRIELTTTRLLNAAKLYEKQTKYKTDLEEIEDLRLCNYDENIYYISGTRSEDRFGDCVMSLKDDKYYVATTLQRFFHRETGIEFTLREYAYVQTFDNDYKFVGNYSSIKKQIGNAVAPEMGKYITSKLKGKTCGDIFAGCGGFTSGAHKNGIITKWAVEWDRDAAITYKANFSEAKVYNTNIKSVNPLDFEKVDIIIGGPPCQGFSNAGSINSGVRTFKSDPRNELYKEFLSFVDVLKPNEFIMENVKEIRDVANEIIKDFEEIGYKVETKLIKGNDIGMKQNRVRFFFLGTKL